MNRKLAEYWAHHAEDFAHVDPLAMEHVEIAFYLGALAYSDCLRQGVTVREEAENFLTASPLVGRG